MKTRYLAKYGRLTRGSAIARTIEGIPDRSQAIAAAALAFAAVAAGWRPNLSALWAPDDIDWTAIEQRTSSPLISEGQIKPGLYQPFGGVLRGSWSRYSPSVFSGNADVVTRRGFGNLATGVIDQYQAVAYPYTPSNLAALTSGASNGHHITYWEGVSPTHGIVLADYVLNGPDGTVSPNSYYNTVISPAFVFPRSGAVNGLPLGNGQSPAEKPVYTVSSYGPSWSSQTDTRTRPSEIPSDNVTVNYKGVVAQRGVHRLSPPRVGEKEKKIRMSGYAKIMGAYGKLTEARDFIRAVYKALPKQYRIRYVNKVKTKKGVMVFKGNVKNLPYSKKMLQQLYKHWDKVDGNAAGRNIALQEYEDLVVGISGQMHKDISKHIGIPTADIGLQNKGGIVRALASLKKEGKAFFD